MKETWADVKGYEGLYQISNLGAVKSLSRVVNQGKYGNTRVIPETLLRPTDNGNGYLIVGLRKDSGRKNFYIHRLVAEHFIEKVDGAMYVNHKDYDTQNNTADNLEWCTQRQNILYSANRMRKPHKQWKVSATGEKYIYHRCRGYRLSIRNVVDKTYPSLEDAVRAREVILRGEKYIAR
jgi:hypothetical protein